MLYPQQNVFRNKLDLSGIWDFKTDPEITGEAQGWFNGLSAPRPITMIPRQPIKNSYQALFFDVEYVCRIIPACSADGCSDAP